MYYSIPEAILHNHILHIYVWLYLPKTHHFQVLIDIFVRLNVMIYVQCGDNCEGLNIPVNMIFSDKSIAKVTFARNLRSSALCFYYVVCHLILSLFETPPEATMHFFVLNNE